MSDFCNHRYWNLLGSSVHRIFQERILEWVAMPFSAFSSVQSLSRVWIFAIPWTAACQASLSITNSQSLLKLLTVESVMSSSFVLFSSYLPSFSASGSFFTSGEELVFHISWQKCWSFNFSISPSNEYSGLSSFRVDWLDLLAVQGTLRSLLQHHSSKASILWCSGFFIVQLSHPYTTTGKTIALTRWTFVGKGMCLLFNMLSRLVIASKEQVSLNFMAVVTICSDFGAPKNKVSLFPLFPHLFAVKWWDQIPWS